MRGPVPTSRKSRQWDHNADVDKGSSEQRVLAKSTWKSHRPPDEACLSLLSSPPLDSIFPINHNETLRPKSQKANSHSPLPDPPLPGATRAAVSRASPSLQGDLATHRGGPSSLSPCTNELSSALTQLPSYSQDPGIALCKALGWPSIAYHRGSTTMADVRPLLTSPDSLQVSAPDHPRLSTDSAVFLK